MWGALRWKTFFHGGLLLPCHGYTRASPKVTESRMDPVIGPVAGSHFIHPPHARTHGSSARRTPAADLSIEISAIASWVWCEITQNAVCLHRSPFLSCHGILAKKLFFFTCAKMLRRLQLCEVLSAWSFSNIGNCRGHVSPSMEYIPGVNTS